MERTIDNRRYIRRYGTLKWFLSSGQKQIEISDAQGSRKEYQPYDEIGVQLNSPHDPAGRCCGHVSFRWNSYFGSGQLAPTLVARGSDLKILALFPKHLEPFHSMLSGALTPAQFMASLTALGIQPMYPDTPLVRATRECDACNGTYRPSDLEQREDRVICAGCAFRSDYKPEAKERTDHTHFAIDDF